MILACAFIWHCAAQRGGSATARRRRETLSALANRLPFVLKSTPPHLNRLCAMSNSSDSKSKKLLDVPAFLRDPQPSSRLRCPTLRIAWLRSQHEPAAASDSEPERQGGDANEGGTKD